MSSQGRSCPANVDVSRPKCPNKVGTARTHTHTHTHTHKHTQVYKIDRGQNYTEKTTYIHADARWKVKDKVSKFTVPIAVACYV